MLNVSRGGYAPDGELGGFFPGQVQRGLFDFPEDAFDERVGFTEVVGECHERVERPHHERGDFEFEHFAVGGGGAGGGILEGAVGGFRCLAGVGDGSDEIGGVGGGHDIIVVKSDSRFTGVDADADAVLEE